MGNRVKSTLVETDLLSGEKLPLEFAVEMQCPPDKLINLACYGRLFWIGVAFPFQRIVLEHAGEPERSQMLSA